MKKLINDVETAMSESLAGFCAAHSDIVRMGELAPFVQRRHLKPGKVALLSGGGSALVELPLDERQTLDDVQQLYAALVTCGAPIADIGKVRRHVSAVKGGRLSVAAGAATKITLPGDTSRSSSRSSEPALKRARPRTT